MEKLVEKGLVKNIGLSNFNSKQIQDILDKGKVDYHSTLTLPPNNIACLYVLSDLSSRQPSRVPPLLHAEKAFAFLPRAWHRPGRVLPSGQADPLG